jgi:hypothetical protein
MLDEDYVGFGYFRLELFWEGSGWGRIGIIFGFGFGVRVSTVVYVCVYVYVHVHVSG